ncbi:hypothetical protein PPYR_11810 [Photinus pyralis]|uniref:EF-hand domain-containing protein n=1 Tax=Photinus pyralis TaxID=7054 RepID=A0A1Y1NLV6_PHOPY|nr:myosin regulatory light chain 2 [Photinus pyralis]KAB0794971.1 hypothetical protein PPYR_11810 [Photinus pyralis]
MADKEKKVKKKKKEDEPAAAAAPAPAADTRTSSKGSSKKAKRSGSNVFSMFSQHQVAEFKEGFQLMDQDKDGIISKSDLRATFDAVGKLANEKELDEMLNEAPGPINFTQLLGLFGTRMQDSGGTDDDDVVIAAFKSFDENGTIDSERFRHALMTWGEKFTAKEVDDAFDSMEIDDKGRIDTLALIQLLTAAPEEEEEGAAA